MANSRTYSKNTNKYTLVIDVHESSVNEANNTSEVYYYFKIVSTTYDFYYRTRIKVWINDRYVYDETRQLNVPVHSQVHLATDTITVPHDSDGRKKCEIFAELEFGADEYYLPSDPIIAESGRTGYMFELTPIVKSPPPSVTFKEIRNLYVGETATVIYEPSEANKYYFRFGYQYKKEDGNYTDMIYPNGMTPIKSDQTSFKLPESIGNDLPNTDHTDIGLWVGLYTGPSSASQYKAKAVKFGTLFISDSKKPIISHIKLTETNSKVSSKFDVFVAGYSKIKIEPIVRPQLGASISKIQIEAIDQVYQQSSIILPIPRFTYTPDTSVISVYVKVTATDSRGKVAINNTLITAYRYSEPKIYSVATSFDSSGKGTLNINHSCYSLERKNTKQIVVKYKRQSESSWRTHTMTPSAYDGTTTITLNDVTSDASWDFEVTFNDSLASATKTASLAQTTRIYITFVSDELNEHVPGLQGPSVRIPSTSYYKSFEVNIVNATPSSYRVGLRWEHTVSKQYVTRWHDRSNNTYYSPGQSVTFSQPTTLYPVFDNNASDIKLPDVLSSHNEVVPLGYSELDSGGVTYPLTHTFTNLKRELTLYLKYKVKFTISGNTGKVSVTEGNSTSGYDEYVAWKNNWEDLDLRNKTFSAIPPQIQNQGTADGEYTSEFLGWDKEIPKIYKNNLPYLVKALWKRKMFIVRFYDQRKGRLLKQIDNVPYGTDVTPPPNPSFPGKQFRGWSADYRNIKSNKDIYGVWSTSNIWIMSRDHVWIPYLPQEG